MSPPFIGAKSFMAHQKKGIHKSNNFTDKNQFKPVIKSIAEVGIF